MKLTVAIPTFNNLEQLRDTLVSLVRNTDFTGRIIVVNNGESGSYQTIQTQLPFDIDWIEAGENLGWAGGVNLALEECKTDLFCMMNDDLLFPLNRSFWKNLTRWFESSPVGGVGVQSNYIFGYQNIHMWQLPDCFIAPLLIGMLAVYRRKLIGEGLDASLPGGDDYDLSIRVVDQGYKLVVDRRCYVHHHGSQTGQRVHVGYWDSEQHRQNTYNAIIRKHGLKRWYKLQTGEVYSVSGDWQKQRPMTLEEAYEDVRTKPSDVYEHATALRDFAESVEHITEFGTDDGTTATVFLSAKPKELVCYDIVRKPEVDWLEANANGTKFQFHQQSTLEADIAATDLLFIDDLHTYDHLKRELELHAKKVRRYILFHDTELCRQGDELGGAPGITGAITEFLRGHPEWRLIHMIPYNNGLMGIARVKC